MDRMLFIQSSTLALALALTLNSVNLINLLNSVNLVNSANSVNLARSSKEQQLKLYAQAVARNQ